MTELVEVNRALAGISQDSTIEDIAETMQKVDFVLGKAKEFKAQLEQAMLDWINANHKDIEIGTVRWYAGVKKDARCKDQRATLEAVLEVSGGDLDQLAQVMAGRSFKCAAMRLLFERVGKPELYEQHFEKFEEQELRDGKPVKKLQKIDQAFVR